MTNEWSGKHAPFGGLAKFCFATFDFLLPHDFSGQSVEFDKVAETIVALLVDFTTGIDEWGAVFFFYNEKSEMFIVTGDTYGNIYIISGKDGKVLHRSQIGNNFESSPIVIDNNIIVGSRGKEIYKLSIQ